MGPVNLFHIRYLGAQRRLTQGGRVNVSFHLFYLVSREQGKGEGVNANNRKKKLSSSITVLGSGSKCYSKIMTPKKMHCRFCFFVCQLCGFPPLSSVVPRSQISTVVKRTHLAAWTN